MIGTIVTIGAVIFTAGIHYELIRRQLKDNTNSITGLRAYIETQLSAMSDRIDKIEDLVEKHNELFQTMGFNSKQDVESFNQLRKKKDD